MGADEGESHTDGDGLDLDALLDVGSAGVVRLLVAEHGLAAEGIDKGGPAYGNKQWAISSGPRGARSAGGTQGDSPVPEAPQTIRQNWIPFLTFFFRRIIFCAVNMVSWAAGCVGLAVAVAVTVTVTAKTLDRLDARD